MVLSPFTTLHKSKYFSQSIINTIMSLTDENNADFNDISESNYNRVHNVVSKVGYSDGITDGRESVFQKGFDCGYENGLLTGFELSKYKAFFSVINKSARSNDFNTESAVYEDLHVPEAKDKSNFKMLELIDQKLAEVSDQQVDHVNQQKDILAKTLPVVTSLFFQ